MAHELSYAMGFGDGLLALHFRSAPRTRLCRRVRWAGSRSLRILVTGSGRKSKPAGNPVMRGEVPLWDAATGQVCATLKIDGGPVKALAFTAVGKTLATGNVDGTVKL